jgi:hypothetical protein
MSEEESIKKAEDLLLQHLRATGQPLSTADLDRWRRGAGLPVSPLDVQGATWNLVQRGKAKFTPEWLLVAL